MCCGAAACAARALPMESKRDSFLGAPHVRSLPRAQGSVTNVPLSATSGSLFMWSFDRVVAGGAYNESAVQPVLHRYNDAKYVWEDACARAWLDCFVRAHSGGAPVRATAPSTKVIDLEVEEGAVAELPIVLE